jgi:hypothetical protein
MILYKVMNTGVRIPDELEKIEQGELEKLEPAIANIEANIEAEITSINKNVTEILTNEKMDKENNDKLKANRKELQENIVSLHNLYKKKNEDYRTKNKQEYTQINSYTLTIAFIDAIIEFIDNNQFSSFEKKINTIFDRRNNDKTSFIDHHRPQLYDFLNNIAQRELNTRYPWKLPPTGGKPRSKRSRKNKKSKNTRRKSIRRRH